MIEIDDFRISQNRWKAEFAQAEMELRAIEREKAIEDIVRLIRRFEILPKDISEAVGGPWKASTATAIKSNEPYFGA